MSARICCFRFAASLISVSDPRGRLRARGFLADRGPFRRRYGIGRSSDERSFGPVRRDLRFRVV